MLRKIRFNFEGRTADININHSQLKNNYIIHYITINELGIINSSFTRKRFIGQGNKALFLISFRMRTSFRYTDYFYVDKNKRINVLIK